MRVEPYCGSAHSAGQAGVSDAEQSVKQSFEATDLQDYVCGECHESDGELVTRLDKIPPVLICHMNKSAAVCGPSCKHRVMIGEACMQRFAAIHHCGESPESSHYTATVSTASVGTFYCDDSTVVPLPRTTESAWENCLSLIHI